MSKTLTMESESETSNWSHNNTYDLKKKLQLDSQVHVTCDQAFYLFCFFQEERENERLIYFYLEPSKGTSPFLHVI